MARQSLPSKGVLVSRIKELEEELSRIKEELAEMFESQARIREEKFVAEIVRLKGMIEQKNSDKK